MFQRYFIISTTRIGFQAQQIVDKYLGGLNSTISEAENNVNAVIVNTHFSFGDARPLPPGIIEVGGCTYKTPKPLPEVSILHTSDNIYDVQNRWPNYYLKK